MESSEGASQCMGQTMAGGAGHRQVKESQELGPWHSNS